jgi:hypothetical protein
MNDPVKPDPDPHHQLEPVDSRRESNPWRTFSILLLVLILLTATGYWVFSRYLFPDAFTPVELNAREQQRLDRKLERVAGNAARVSAATPLEPEPYSEEGASREIHFSEKELNALLAKNTHLASKLAIDLSDNLASAKMLIDLDPDMPFVGGNTLKVTAGMELKLLDGRPQAILKGVSLWGVPLPNAWLGNMKNRDLIEEFGESGGFWQAVAAGVDSIEVRQGELHIRLRE